MKKLKTFLLIAILIFSIPGFLTGVGVLLIPVTHLFSNPSTDSIPFLILAVPTMIGFAFWPGIMAWTDVSFILSLFIHPLLLIYLLYVAYTLQIKRKKKIIFFVFIILCILGYLVQFWSGEYWRETFFKNYHAAYMTQPGVRYDLVTKPGLVEGLRKKFLAAEELGKGDFNYNFIGWKDDQNLVFEKGVVRYEYNLRSKKVNKLAHSTDKYYKKTCELRVCLKDQIEYSWIANGTLVFPSPDNKKFTVVSEYIYGPQDILVITKN